MKKLLNLKTAFLTSLVFILAGTCSLLFMPYASSERLDDNMLPTRLAGVWLWSGLVIGWGLFIVIHLRLKKKSGYKPAELGKLGIISFFSNAWAKAADITAAVSLLVFVVLVIVVPESFAAYVFLTLLIFALQMHCVLNGRNFKYILKTINKLEETK